MEKLILTLCILSHDGQILLGLKKKGLGVGRWNGFGGKVESGESIEAATIREMKEESGVDVSNIEKIGVLNFKAPNRPDIEMHIFKTSTFMGEPIETDEMRPEWFHKTDLPFTEMWQSDLYWWPLYFHNRKFTGTFAFDSNDRVVSHELKEVGTLEA